VELCAFQLVYNPLKSVLMEMTKETAINILESYHICDEAGVPFKGIEITNISTHDSDGLPFEWEETGEPYAIVNLNAMNEYGANRASQQLEDEEYQDACNNNLSLRVTLEEAENLSKGMLGTLVLREAEVSNEDGDTEIALLPKKFTPAVAKVARKRKFGAKVTVEDPQVEA
jgi:hypothetical protein